MDNELIGKSIQYLQERNVQFGVAEKLPEATPDESGDLFLKRQLQVEATESNARLLLEYVARIPQKKELALTNEYIFANLSNFLRKDEQGEFIIQPEKVDLAIEVNEKINTFADIYGFEPQFIPTVNTAVYASREFLVNNNIDTNNPEEMIHQLNSLSETKSKAENSMIRHIVRYAEDFDPESNDSFENYLTREMALDTHKNISRWTDTLAFMGQPQGFEIEVLSHVTNSPRAVERNTEHWLPRGIPYDQLPRKDWELTALLGIHEDIGERRYQVFEMASDPAETSAAHGATIFALTAAGFISEQDLSNVYEGYSFHVSTIFPTEILNKKSLENYKKNARAIGGAFASDQRIGFGGFLSGGSEIDDKTNAGTLREIRKIKDVDSSFKGKMKPGYSLVEIRNLDINQNMHYTAMQSKQSLDYAFRCYWQIQNEPKGQWTDTEHAMAKIWETHSRSIDSIFKKHGISNGDNAWKELADANESSVANGGKDSIRDELQKAIRKTTRDIRAEIHQVMPEETIRRELSQPHNILSEPLGQEDDRIYIPAKLRQRLGIETGDEITIRYQGQDKKIQVAQAKIRGNHTTDSQSNVWRLSDNVLTDLSITTGTNVTTSYDRLNQVLNFADIPDPEGIHKIHTPRTLDTEPLGQVDDRIYMLPQDRERFGLNPGDEITIRVGKKRQKVLVAQAKIREETGSTDSIEDNKWRLSQNVIDTFQLPNDIKLQSKFNNETKELSFGPIIGILLRERSDSENPLHPFSHQDKLTAQLAEQAEKMGGVLVAFDPDVDWEEEQSEGMIDGYIMKSDGTFSKGKLPFPDVLYDKNVYWRDTKRGNTFEENLKINGVLTEEDTVNYISPPELQEITSDKFSFSQMIEKHHLLNKFQPETMVVDPNKPDTLKKLIKKHGKVILKPRNGQKGQGLITISKTDSGYEYAYPIQYDQENDRWKLETYSAKNINDFLAETESLRGDQDYIAQEYMNILEIDVPEGGKKAVELRMILQRGVNRRLTHVGTHARLTGKDLASKEYEMDGLGALQMGFDEDEANDIYTQSTHLGTAVAKLIEEQINKPIGEIAVDIAVTESGDLFILEANSKPEIRGMFSRTNNNDSARSSVSNPVGYAAAMAGYI